MKFKNWTPEALEQWAALLPIVKIMREILFRGKRLDNGEWVEGYYVHLGPTDCQRAYIIPTYASALYVIEVDPFTVGQYTGLMDKNGKRIFEGDIIRWTDWKAETYERVGVYDTEWNRFAVFLNGAESAGMNKWLDLGGIEVSGNIHDNPELLGGDNGFGSSGR